MVFESNVICEWIEETQPGPRLHPADPLLRAQHRAWMEFGSAILADPAGPWFAGAAFSLVDAVFAPVFRYFDVFDTIADLGIFTGTPCVRAGRDPSGRAPPSFGIVVQLLPDPGGKPWASRTRCCAASRLS